MDVAENKRETQLSLEKSIDDQETVSGTVKRIVFNNPENGYHILRVTLDRGKFESTVVGVGLGTLAEQKGRGRERCYSGWADQDRAGRSRVLDRRRGRERS